MRQNFEFGISESNAISMGRVYEEIINKKGIPKVPFVLSEDETAIVKEIVYCQEIDKLVGFCGKVDSKHMCVEDCNVEVGEGEKGYENIVSAFKVNEIGGYARAILLNPLHPCLPKLPVLVMPTCKKFDSKFVRNQWDQLQAIYDKHLRVNLGPLIGQASDGDSRRRKLFLKQMTAKEAERFQPISKDLGFIFSCRKVTKNGGQHYDLVGLGDNDYIHCHKKLINNLD